MDAYRTAASDIVYHLATTANADPVHDNTTGALRRKSFRRVLVALNAANVATLPCTTPLAKAPAATRTRDVARVARDVIDLLGFQHVCAIADAVLGEQYGDVAVADEELEVLVTVCGSTTELTQRATSAQLCRLLGALRVVIEKCTRDPYLKPVGGTGSKLRNAMRKVFDDADVAFLVNDFLPLRSVSPRKRK